MILHRPQTSTIEAAVRRQCAPPSRGRLTLVSPLHDQPCQHVRVAASRGQHPMLARIRTLLLVLLLAALPAVGVSAAADEVWVSRDDSGKAEIQLYFFWSLTCPHCTEAKPFINAIAQERPWVRVQALELSRSA
ncbi:hypothetical protein RZS08_19440, partial [Arthrospira platensis SPKY1]|nr:hypothetical protein [Arthrospira platensis SPKY1]